jgi:hypothetical protein
MLCCSGFELQNYSVTRFFHRRVSEHVSTYVYFCFFVCYRRPIPPPKENNVLHHQSHIMTDFDVELPYKTAREQQRKGPSAAAASGPDVAAFAPLSSGSNLGMDKSTLKVHLSNGSFNVVRFGDATDIKVSVLCIFIRFALETTILQQICCTLGYHSPSNVEKNERSKMFSKSIRYEDDQHGHPRGRLAPPRHDNVSSPGLYETALCRRRGLAI